MRISACHKNEIGVDTGVGSGLDAITHLGGLYERQGRLDEAIALDPTIQQSFSNRAAVRQSLGDLEGALLDLEQALRLEPTDGFALAKRGEIRGAQGDLRGGLEDLREATRLVERVLA